MSENKQIGNIPEEFDSGYSYYENIEALKIQCKEKDVRIDKLEKRIEDLERRVDEG